MREGSADIADAVPSARWLLHPLRSLRTGEVTSAAPLRKGGGACIETHQPLSHVPDYHWTLRPMELTVKRWTMCTPPCCVLRGFPFSFTRSNVQKFLSDCSTPCDAFKNVSLEVNKRSARFTGRVFMTLPSAESFETIHETVHNKWTGDRYIEVIPHAPEEMLLMTYMPRRLSSETLQSRVLEMEATMLWEPS